MFLFNHVIVPTVRWTCLINLILPSLYFIFKQNSYTIIKQPDEHYRCSVREQRDRVDSKRLLFPLLHLEWYAKLQIRVLFILYSIDIVKYALMVLIDLELMEHYRVIDCLLIGRLAFLGRSSGSSKYVALLITLFFATYRLVLVTIKPDFNFDFAQFVINGSESALDNEIKSLDIKDTQGNTFKKSSSWAFTKRCKRDDHPTSLRSQRNRHEILTNKSQSMVCDSCYFTPNYFDMTTNLFHNHLRPNRTVQSWNELNLYIFLLDAFVWIYFVVIAVATYRVVGPTVLTETGFQLNYKYCHMWCIQQKQNNMDADISLLCPNVQANGTVVNIRTLPFFLPLDHLFELNWFSFLRVSYDIFENHFMYIDFVSTFALHTQIVFHIIFDSYINYKSIRRRLIEITHYQMSKRKSGIITLKSMVQHDARLKQLAQDKHLASHMLDRMFDHARAQRQLARELEATSTIFEHILRWLTSDAPKHHVAPITSENCESEIVRIQTILVDHFVMINRYNAYIESHIGVCMSLWIVYTCLLCLWMSIAGSQAVLLEFYVGFLVSFILVIFMLIGPSMLHSCNYQLYRRIATMMALDDNFVNTKTRWIHILKYYYPVPLYCFSFFRSSQISWLFCLKLYSWVITALLVVGSFLFNHWDTFTL